MRSVARVVEPLVEPAGYVPLTERLIQASRLPAWLVVAVIAIVPVANMLTYGWTEATGGPPAPPLSEILPIRIVNSFLVVFAFVVGREGMRRIERVVALDSRPSPRRGSWLTWLLPPLVLAAALSITFVGDLLSRGLIAGSVTAPIAAVDLLSGLLLNLVIMSAFWTGIVALAAVARLGHERLPGAFPEDRSLGLRPVGSLVLFVFVTYVAAYAPVFAVGTTSLPNFLIAVGVFGLGVAVIVLATWRVHSTMATERERQIARARSNYADAYREASKSPDGSRASRLLEAEALLRGAESIFAWPFDEGMQRIVAVVATGVITALAVRLVFFPFGL